MKIITIRFTKKSTERFFGLIDRSVINRGINVPLNNNSQLAGFSNNADFNFSES